MLRPALWRPQHKKNRAESGILFKGKNSGVGKIPNPLFSLFMQMVLPFLCGESIGRVSSHIGGCVPVEEVESLFP